MQKSYVYLGLVEAARGGWHVKIGKSDSPEKRAKAYATHCPGGLQSMYSAALASSSAAHAAEARALSRVAKIDGAEPVGYEWYFVPGDKLQEVFQEIESVVGPVERVPLKPVTRPNRWY